jgi:hypothetical protein
MDNKEPIEQPQNGHVFNPNEHLIQLKSRSGSADYLPVQWRLVWFREVCPHGTIETEELEVDLDREMEEEAYAWNNETRRSEKVVKRAKGYARYKATVTDGKGGKATGTKCEKAVSFPDYVEKAETGAIGRALAALGYGTQFAGDEFDERHRIVDAPVDRPDRNESNGSNGQQRTNEKLTENGAQMTDQQWASIEKLYRNIERKVPPKPDGMSYFDAKNLIADLSQQYREMRSKK